MGSYSPQESYNQDITLSSLVIYLYVRLILIQRNHALNGKYSNSNTELFTNLKVNSWIGLSCLIRVSSSCLSRWCTILLNSATLRLNSSISSRWVWVLLDKSCRYPSWLACSRGKASAPPLVRPVPLAFLWPLMVLLPDSAPRNSPSFLAMSIVWFAICSATCVNTNGRRPYQNFEYLLLSIIEYRKTRILTHGRKIRVTVILWKETTFLNLQNYWQ